MRKQVLAILFLALVNSAVAQTDTLFFQPAIDLAIGTSSSIKDAGEAIYNGREHLGYLPSIKGIAYYTSAEWQPGSIVYRNVSYKNVFLKYDLVKDEVIIRHVNGFTGVTLFTPRVESVIILNKHFVNLPGDGKLLSAGLYEKVNK
ncbi:MAG: hypothetical protein ACXWCT_16010, partial [Flavitalea sp.]